MFDDDMSYKTDDYYEQWVEEQERIQQEKSMDGEDRRKYE